MTNLRRSPGPFFFFLFVSFLATLTMSSIFRTIAAGSKTIAGALAPTAIFMLGLIIYTGFTIPTSYMKPWFRWINYINPIGYTFESLMINEFHGREFPCAANAFVPAGPGYANATGLQRACGVAGAQPGSSSVLGDAFLQTSFEYVHSHKWRCVVRSAGLNIPLIVFLYPEMSQSCLACLGSSRRRIYSSRIRSKQPSRKVKCSFSAEDASLDIYKRRRRFLTWRLVRERTGRIRLQYTKIREWLLFIVRRRFSIGRTSFMISKSRESRGDCWTMWMDGWNRVPWRLWWWSYSSLSLIPELMTACPGCLWCW